MGAGGRRGSAVFCVYTLLGVCLLYWAAWECSALCLAKEMFGFVAKSSRAGLVKQLRAEACAVGYV